MQAGSNHADATAVRHVGSYDLWNCSGAESNFLMSPHLSDCAINQQRQCKIRVRNSAARKTRSRERSPQFTDRASTTQKLQGSDSFFPASMKRCRPRDCALSQSSNWFSSRRESVNQSARIRFGMLLVAVVKFRNRHRSNMRISPGRDRGRRPGRASTSPSAVCRSARTHRSGCRRADTSSRRCAGISA
jgi:hypothetical protein